MRARPASPWAASARFRNPPAGGAKQRGRFSPRFFPVVPRHSIHLSSKWFPVHFCSSTRNYHLKNSFNKQFNTKPLTKQPLARRLERAAAPGSCNCWRRGKPAEGLERTPYSTRCRPRSSATHFQTRGQRSGAISGPASVRARVRPHRGGPSRPALPSSPKGAAVPATARSTSPLWHRPPSEPHRAPGRPQPPSRVAALGAGPAAPPALPSGVKHHGASRS